LSYDRIHPISILMDRPRLVVSGIVLEMGFSIISQASTFGSLYLHSIWIGASPSLPTWKAVKSEDGVVEDDDDEDTVEIVVGKERIGGSSVLGEEELKEASTSIEHASGVKHGAATDRDGSLV
jgi:hypothetical protein